MKIHIQAIVNGGTLENELLSIVGFYDPKEIISKYEGKVVEATLILRVSKKGNFVAVLNDIKEI